MGNVGDRLEEARKRQGISIREASEATKIRTEYLSNFENDNFDFDLPDVYKRGFVKMYARYLKIDIDKFMIDVDALMMGRSKGKGGAREFFGRMDLPSIGGGSSAQDSTPASIFNEGDSGVGIAFKKNGGNPSVPAADKLEQGTDKTLYWKIGLIFIGTFVVVGLLALLIQTLFSSGGSSDTPAQTPPAQVAPASFVIVANGSALVRVQTTDNEQPVMLFNQVVQPGQRYTVPLQGNTNVRVVSNKIEDISVDFNGRNYVPKGSGLGQWLFNANGPL